MLFIKFEGWFQCRLATDPDPADETRGVSGYMKALPGEPDFDRIIRFNEAPVRRLFGPNVGVRVTKVAVDGVLNPNHSLLDARVDLMNEPQFFGFNGIVADDGEEAIVPFDLQIEKGEFLLRRARTEREEFPFSELMAKNGIIPSPLENAEATGIYDLPLHFTKRVENLRSEQIRLEAEGTANNLALEGVRRRIEFLTTSSAAMRFFNFRMEWVVRLSGDPILRDPQRVLPHALTEGPWSAYLWMGAWDPDTNCGYTSGCLRIDWKT